MDPFVLSHGNRFMRKEKTFFYINFLTRGLLIAIENLGDELDGFSIPRGKEDNVISVTKMIDLRSFKVHVETSELIIVKKVVHTSREGPQ